MKCFVRDEREETQLIRTKVLRGLPVLRDSLGAPLPWRPKADGDDILYSRDKAPRDHRMGRDSTVSTTSYAIPAFS